jgi:FkbM family methyltransferase
MVKSVKKILYKVLGQKLYLKAMHYFFFKFYDLGLLRNNFSFKYHYFVKNLIQDGDYVVDLGANLGYFSKIFSRLAGKEGKVICIEPVKIFFETLKWGLRKQYNCTLHNYALGLEHKMIELVLPKSDGVFRTGLAHIQQADEKNTESYIFQTEMIIGSSLLIDLPKLNYIKCDIEGYEEFVLPELRGVIDKFKPILQVETDGKAKKIIFDMMTELGYIQYSVYKNKMVKNFSNKIESGDYLFIHSDTEKEVLSRIK